MKRLFSIFLCSLFLNTVSASAEEPTPTWAKYRPAADWVSTGLLFTDIGLDTLHAFRSGDRTHALIRQSLRVGATIGVSELVKAVVHRTRPDGSDNKSFFSEHTALAFASGGWNVSISVPVSLGVGYGRMAAAKHHPSDVVVGALTGSLIAALIK